MVKWLRRRFGGWLAGWVIRYVQVGAHCGLCGTWMKYELAPRVWAISICNRCATKKE